MLTQYARVRLIIKTLSVEKAATKRDLERRAVTVPVRARVRGAR